MGYATREQMKKTAETLSQGNDTINISAGQMAPEITTPDVSELDGGVLHELDANQTLGSYSSSSWTPPGSSIARLNQISHTSNGSLSIASAVDSLYANPTDDTSRRTEPAVNPPPPYITGSRPAFPGNTESEKSATRLHELAQPPPASTPPPAYNNSVRHIEGYIPYRPGRPGPEVAHRDVARPRSEPRVLTEDQMPRQTATTTTTIPEPAVQDTEYTSSVVPSPISSPEITPVARVPSLPYTIPPLDAFETVRFSVTMDRAAPTDSPVSPSNTSDTENQWRWDIQF
jgi:hypothetical protein